MGSQTKEHSAKTVNDQPSDQQCIELQPVWQNFHLCAQFEVLFHQQPVAYPEELYNPEEKAEGESAQRGDSHHLTLA